MPTTGLGLVGAAESRWNNLIIAAIRREQARICQSAVEESRLPLMTLRKMRVYTLLVAALLLNACSNGDKSACPAGDLSRFARDQALRGEAASLPGPGCELSDSEKAVYLQGREDGIARYCKAARGYALGVDGKSVDQSLCDEAGAKELNRGFEVGSNLRTHLTQRDRLLSQAKDAERIANSLGEGIPARAAIENEAATLRLEARSHENEVEALRGIVAIEKW